MTDSIPDHTPGPWRIEYRETRVRWPVIVARLNGEVYELASMEESTHVHNEEDEWERSTNADRCEADAALISAAPELAQALQAMDQAMRGQFVIANFPKLQAAHENARRALKKAGY
jgi:uncharacterized protein